MTSSQLMIPNRINAGFQNRNDTYTTKLGYVIYYDQKGVLRKQKSWDGWRDHKIKNEEYDNVPTEGFVLNKKVGGYKSDWNYRSAKIRIYDPRDWEFEITLENLLFILAECDCSRGKGLEGKFVYAWHGTELVLLPERSEAYKNSKEYTDLQTKGVKVKELIAGASYQKKDQQVVIYLGKFTKFTTHDVSTAAYRWRRKEVTGDFHVFWNVKHKQFEWHSSMKPIAKLQSDVVTPDFANLVDSYNKSMWGSKPVRLFFKGHRTSKNETSRQWDTEGENGEFLQCSSWHNSQWNTDYTKRIVDELPNYIQCNAKVYIKDGILCYEYVGKTMYREKDEQAKQKRYSGYYQNKEFLDKWIEPTNKSLWVELESGSKYQLLGYNLIDHTKKEEDYDGYDEDED